MVFLFLQLLRQLRDSCKDSLVSLHIRHSKIRIEVTLLNTHTHTLMNFKGNAISAAVMKQFKPAHFPSYIKAFAFWDSTVRMMLSLWLSPNPPPGQTHSLARQPGRDKYKGTTLSSHEKAGTYLLSFQKFLYGHLCKTGSEQMGLLDYLTQRYKEFYSVFFKPRHHFTYKFYFIRSCLMVRALS